MVQITANLRQDYHSVQGKILQTVGEGLRSKCQITIFNTKLIRNSLVLCSPLLLRRLLLIKDATKTLKRYPVLEKCSLNNQENLKYCIKYYLSFHSQRVQFFHQNKMPQMYIPQRKLLNAFEEEQIQTLAFLKKYIGTTNFIMCTLYTSYTKYACFL